MEKITIEIALEKIQNAFILATDEIFKNSYSNPVKDLLGETLKEKKNEIKEIINSIIVEAITKQEFKEKLANAVVQRMVKTALDN